ncbi:M23 family metallopeptidase [Streptacidiphilus anmyonensis]|uniref:M23 family metallopeptidase n=1 Tax=Streptacidiphilus anmyonensis TaxID=405782 RepID=UPI00069508AC|nr:M23 family metallopeptidase [Streptacidiphilus anmyonensis]
MTADTSWYGQQTLVPPDSSHQPYPPYGTYADPYETHGSYGDPYAAHHQYGYAQQQHDYAAPYDYGAAYGAGYATSATQPTSGYVWPDYYQAHNAQHEATLVVEYGGSTDHVAHSAYPGYVTHHGYAAYPDHDACPDYSVYDTATDVSRDATVAGPGDGFDTLVASPVDEFGGSGPGAAREVHEVRETAEAVFGSQAAEDLAGDGSGPRSDEEGGCPGDAGPGSRRRGVRRRSAVLTIAVPSLAVLGVAGAAAATMGPLRAHHTDTTAASTSATSQAKAQALAASEARDAAQRAARDKARTALQLREAAARKAAAEAPRYVLPIAYHTGLSALFGQAGTHWMQLHTGIDFPVPVGTPVHAVTGGTVTTEWNPFYGYMVKLTAPDGTVTWYCHLSSYRVRSGQVKVGDIIAYSGDTGNSTGPHLHFEVHPDGGPAVDPLPWLLARGLDPR